MRIRLENVSKHFKTVKAVDDLSITIEDGELVSFLGPSGCGKSTTLFILAGLYGQDGGKIFFDDQRIDQLETEKRGIGMVFQNYALYPHMTVAKNILFPLEMQKTPKGEALKRAEEVMEMLRISQLKDRKPSQISGGQQQRVAIARALVKNPRVLLMDEPLSNLDAKLRVETREEIRKLQQNLGITTIFVTHDQDEAASISDRIMIMDKGRLQQFDKPREIYDNPDNLFTAKFIGTSPINIFSVQREGQRLSLGGTSQSIPIKARLANIKEEDFIIGLRPEHMEVASLEAGVLEGLVDQVEMQGKDNLLVFRLGEIKCRLFVSPEKSPHVGQRIGVRINEDKILAFDKESGKKL